MPHRNEGKVMFSASVDGTITLWAPNGTPYSTLEVHACITSITHTGVFFVLNSHVTGVIMSQFDIMVKNYEDAYVTN